MRTDIHRGIVILLVLAGVSGCISRPNKEELQTVEVPELYQDIYDQIDKNLAKAEKHLEENWDGQTGDTSFACELLGANSSKGPLLR